jgi:hypothetical protein
MIKLNDNGGYKAEYLHQIFGENEEIKGYRKLWIDIFITGAQLLPYVEVNYHSKDSVADDIIGRLNETVFHQGI